MSISARVLSLILATVAVSSIRATAQNYLATEDTIRFIWKRYHGNPVYPATAGT